MFGYFRLTLWIPYTRFLITSQPFAPTRYTAKVFGSTVALEEQFSLRCCAGVEVMGPPEMRRRGSRPTKCNSFIQFPVENTLGLRYILRSATQIPTLKESRVSWWFHKFHSFLNLFLLHSPRPLWQEARWAPSPSQGWKWIPWHILGDELVALYRAAHSSTGSWHG